MAASSYQHPHPFLLDPVFLQNTNSLKNMAGLLDDENIKNNCFPPIYPLYGTPLEARLQEAGLIDHSSKVVLSDTETSVTKKQSTESSAIVDKLDSGEQVTQKVTPMNRKRKHTNGSSLTSAQSKDSRERNSKNRKKCNDVMKEDQKKDQKRATEDPPTGYIHVRARRGQATDSHSLAERVRREKISERMKILQHLVPGCDKVTGKAQMLDEIINYVQSLQNQVEFLSMKLASLNPLFCDFGMDLDPFIIRPEKLSGTESPLPCVQQCSPSQSAAAFADAITVAATSATTNFATVNNYPNIDTSASLLLQGQRASVNELITKDGGSLFWDVEEQRQKLMNPFGHDLCSFH